jgi:hypothetical protein
MLGMTSPRITKSVELAVAAKRRGIEVLQACKTLSDAPRLPAIRWDAAQRIMDRAVARGPAPRQRVTRLHFGD